MNDKELDELLDIFTEIIERNGSARNKAREILYICTATLEESVQKQVMDFRILERVLDLPKQ